MATDIAKNNLSEDHWEFAQRSLNRGGNIGQMPSSLVRVVSGKVAKVTRYIVEFTKMSGGGDLYRCLLQTGGGPRKHAYMVPGIASGGQCPHPQQCWLVMRCMPASKSSSASALCKS